MEGKQCHVGSLLTEKGELVTKDMEKAEVTKDTDQARKGQKNPQEQSTSST